MALIKCIECGKEISDKAEMCPSCGNPVQTLVQTAPIEIERTNKRWKKKRLWGFTLFIIGLITMTQSASLGIFIILIAIFIGIIANVGAWWTNG